MLRDLTFLASLSELRPRPADVGVLQAWIDSCDSEQERLYLIRCLFPKSHSTFGSTLIGWLISEGFIHSAKLLANSPREERKRENPNMVDIKRSLVRVAHSVVSIEGLRKAYYCQEGFSLTRIFSSLANGGDFITLGTLREATKRCGLDLHLPSLISSIAKTDSLSGLENKKVGIKAFRQSISPTLHYPDSLILADDDRSSIDDIADDDDYRITIRHDNIDSNIVKYDAIDECVCDDAECWGKEQVGFDSMDLGPAGMGGLEDEGGVKEGDECLGEGGMRYGKLESPFPTKDKRIEQEYAPQKADLRIPFSDHNKEVSKKIDFDEAQYWNQSYQVKNGSKRLDLALPLPIARSPDSGPKHIKASPVSLLNTTLPKDTSNREMPVINEIDGSDLRVKRQISFDDL